MKTIKISDIKTIKAEKVVAGMILAEGIVISVRPEKYPGRRKRVFFFAEQKFCSTHDWIRLTPAGTCTSCASERLEKGANA